MSETKSASTTIAHHALVGVAEEMGEALKRAAFSPNIKERQDYSCAVFDAKARLIAQAAHLPVHLGSMPRSVEAVVERFNLAVGDVAIVNDPYSGGTHLPDITLVAPVFSISSALIGYVAARAHHADVGGASPGSMAPQLELIAEGLVVPPTRLVRGGTNDADVMALILANTRTPVEREGDLHAQLAALKAGVGRLAEIEQRWGAKAFRSAGKALREHSSRLMSFGLQALTPGRYEVEELLDDDGAGATDVAIRLVLTVGDDDSLTFDFRESDNQVAGGVNAVKPVTESACLYAALCFCSTRPPVNEGCTRAISVLTRPGTVVDARKPAAVAGGNVETSQRIVDACLAALGVAAPGLAVAQSQGTMNNLSVGGVDSAGRRFNYYETIAGGCGAGEGQTGAGATHSHMTNTLNTPIESLEHAYPLRVEEYAIREGSGGEGSYRGGEGVVRRIRAMAECDFSIVSERRKRGPSGLNGGEHGLTGQNRLVRADGTVEALPGKCSGKLRPGDAVEIATPGGGGFGR